ncbi:DNA replication/repair protein RecF [Aquimarina brevivitae]|uniref:DNA replication and repair protein RecF n=1 Tax=Aquimarina brevivitae TaxID=323412 RepID=A0A4Q7P0E7_9FLAO|nr:DNA replication/repair protein RecF [Aquimarina brevivitae]RZS93263.1 DNA replication and repair protein RecF [Aquimarina brevivitae]
MILKSLVLLNYKNFESRNFDFDEKINCLVGNNGVGKTNILDAIYHLSFGKSYFNPITSQNIRHDSDFFVVEGIYEKQEREEKVIVSAKRGQKKVIKRNGKAYDTFSEHIGFLPLVIISPADRDLITEGSETRRKFIDGVISQSDQGYLTTLLKYTKAVSQRNALLKYFAANHTFDQDTLAVYNEQLHELGSVIYAKRKEFLAVFTPIFLERYHAITSGNEEVSLTYQSKLEHTDLLTLLQTHLEKDRALQYTSVGVHKDDLAFTINEHPIKKFGSQGQQKSFLIALKLAQFEFIKMQSKVNPLLLLDDVFDKLDETRVEHIIKLVDDQNFGQLFISDTHADRTENVVKKISQSYKMFKLS